ncbi:MAG: acyl-protein synthetase [bacterium]|nr:acyl-protein synthetase [bacterium]
MTPRSPSLDHHPALEALFSTPDPYAAGPEVDELFVVAMREAVAWHLHASPAYANLCRTDGFDLDSLRGVVDLARVPHVFVNVFKTRELLSIPSDRVALHLTSSGTTGQKSQVFFDAASRDRGLATVDRAYAAMGITSEAPGVRYLLLAHDPAEALRVGTAFTDTHLTRFAPALEKVYALRWSATRGEFVFREDEAIATLERYATSGDPVRIIGFPAFLHRLAVNRLREGLPSLALPASSWVLTGGGWKTSESERIDPETFRSEVHAAFGIDPACMRDGYGMVEHGIPYLECEAHRFHVPVWARALVRDVTTLASVPEGEVGFLELLTPFNRAMPTLALLTSDLARLERDCPCGRPTVTIRLSGRAGTRKNRGCALSAAAMLEKGGHA